MTREPGPQQLLARLKLGGTSAFDASFADTALKLARPDAELASRAALLGIDRPRLIVDLFERTYDDLDERRRRGAYYTPPELVSAMLDRVPLDGEILDPAAGAGAFLLALVRRLGPEVLDRLHACDLNPAALDAAALVLEAELGPDYAERVHRWRRTRARVLDFLRDRISLDHPDLIIGNPPYGRAKSAELAEGFPELGGEIDLYACFLVEALRRVNANGTVALLIPDSWMTNARTRMLRRVVAERGVGRIVDFGKPFRSARDTRVHAVIVGGAPVENRAECLVESRRGNALEPMAAVGRGELAKQAEAGWFLYRTNAERDACKRIEGAVQRIGDRFEVIYGLRTGSNASCIRADGDGNPLVGGEDLDAFDRRWRPKRLDPEEAIRRRLLGGVARQEGRWKLGIQRIRSNAVVSFRRWVEAAPLSPEEIGLDSLTLLADADSDSRNGDSSNGDSRNGLSVALLALLGVLNSSILNRWYRLTYTDVNVKPIYLAQIPLPDLTDSLSRAVKARLASPGDLSLERAIDRLVADAYGLDAAAIDTLEQGFWGEELANRPLPSSSVALDLIAAAAPEGRTSAAR